MLDSAKFRVSRREFIKVSSLSGIWLVTRNLTGFASASDLPGAIAGGWSGQPGKARYRIEGMAKVRGQKIYARDFRARDVEDWPPNETCAMVLRTSVTGRILMGIDLSVLPSDLQPIKTVTADDLTRDGLVFPDSDKTAGSSPNAPGSLFVAKGTAPEFLGQPVAILLFKDYRTYFRAHRLLQFNSTILKYGAEAAALVQHEPQAAFDYPRLAFKATDDQEFHAQAYDLKTYPVQLGPGEEPFYAPPTYLTRYSDASGEKFSQVKNGVTDPSGSSPADKEAAHWRQVIEADMQSHGWTTFNGEYQTQQLDPMFMEPEAGLSWLDFKNQTLHLLVGTQSTNGCVADAVTMFGAPKCAFKVSTIVLNSCYPGGGFGGRDVSTFPTMLAIAAAYSETPVRMAYDRFEQFQSGLKQLGVAVSQKLAVDQSGRFQAIVGKYNLLAGGRNNYSQWIAELAGYCAGGGYVIPRVVVDAKARASVGVIAGSMRGFGGPQAAFAVESLIDEAAIALKVDPIELRERNALAKGGYTVTGYSVSHSLRIAEICQRARQHQLWTERESRRHDFAADSMLYGVGFALANQAFGTGIDGVMAAVNIAPDGAIDVTTNCVDMGNGSATSLAVSTAQLGANATRVHLGEVSLFAALKNTNRTKNGKNDWGNPRYTPAGSMSSSACITAFHQVHAVKQACSVLLKNAIWPAARALWKRPADEPFDSSKVSWGEGGLIMAGQQPLPVEQLARALHQTGGITGAMVHASYLGQWIIASFPINQKSQTFLIDALAIRNAGNQTWTVIDRNSIAKPPDEAWNYGRSLYAPSGTLAAVLVDPRQGQIQVLALHSYLEAGSVVQPDLLMGQYYGGAAMGIGYAFHEELPQTYGGPGEGKWNLNRYHVPMWEDVPLDRITLELLEPQPSDDPPRGIAEAVLCPVPPALSNAVGHATGKRFNSLPITPKKILEALR